MAKADLHIHTTKSDGKYSPTEIVQLAKQKGIHVIAITDHDTIDGLQEGRLEAANLGITFINGVEITSDFNGREAHVLAYAFDETNPDFLEFLAKQHELRINRIHEMIAKLSKLGIELKFESIQEIAGTGTIGRPHLAKALVQFGFVKNMSEAFGKYIGNYGPAYFKSEHPDFKDVISVVKKAKGKTVLAHPALSYSQKELDEWVLAGIQGFEMIHPRHPYNLQLKFENLANMYGLIKTGGSDFHGFYSKDNVYFGVVTINALQVQNLVHLNAQNA